MPRLGGQPCGCDPSANHTCEGHAGYRDEFTRTFPALSGDRVMVEGPDSLGLFTVGTCRLSGEFLPVKVERFVLEDIIEELQRRLKERV